ncbi:MAG: sulfotransferase domain-containing protein [Bacteroidales bacterium]|nr:sulfotransferase domain-containing protein [Bacteroidales bacterium]
MDKNNLNQIIKKYSFNEQKKSLKNNDKSFLRKGISGDWKNYFSKEACKVFNDFAGKELIKWNYEKDSSWIKNWVL